MFIINFLLHFNYSNQCYFTFNLIFWILNLSYHFHLFFYFLFILLFIAYSCFLNNLYYQINEFQSFINMIQAYNFVMIRSKNLTSCFKISFNYSLLNHNLNCNSNLNSKYYSHCQFVINLNRNHFNFFNFLATFMKMIFKIHFLILIFDF